jgi:translation initiation factor 2B subunit (eIF-2B alpha/beta/delta family)
MMSVVEMAKAHLQNVHSRVEDLKNQKKLIEDEINKLSLYIQKGLQDIEDLETDEGSDSEKVSNK